MALLVLSKIDRARCADDRRPHEQSGMCRSGFARALVLFDEMTEGVWMAALSLSSLLQPHAERIRWTTTSSLMSRCGKGECASKKLARRFRSRGADQTLRRGGTLPSHSERCRWPDARGRRGTALCGTPLSPHHNSLRHYHTTLAATSSTSHFLFLLLPAPQTRDPLQLNCIHEHLLSSCTGRT